MEYPGRKETYLNALIILTTSLLLFRVLSLTGSLGTRQVRAALATFSNTCGSMPAPGRYQIFGDLLI